MFSILLLILFEFILHPLNNFYEENHVEIILILDCRNLIREMNSRVIHILREANCCADKLAKIGGAQGDQAVRMLIPGGVHQRLKCSFGSSFCLFLKFKIIISHRMF